MVKLSDAIQHVETTLPVCGAKVVIKDSLSFDDEIAIRAIPDPDKRGGETLKRVLVSWEIYLDDETIAPADNATLGALSRSDTKYLLEFINKTVTRPRTPAEAEQQEKDRQSLSELADAFDGKPEEKPEETQPEPEQEPIG